MHSPVVSSAQSEIHNSFCERFPDLPLKLYFRKFENEFFYSCVYFDSDKSVSPLPKSRCALRGPFAPGEEAEVNWGGQMFIGIILKTADKGMCHAVFYFSFFLHHRIEPAQPFLLAASEHVMTV